MKLLWGAAHDQNRHRCVLVEAAGLWSGKRHDRALCNARLFCVSGRRARLQAQARRAFPVHGLFDVEAAQSHVRSGARRQPAPGARTLYRNRADRSPEGRLIAYRRGRRNARRDRLAGRDAPLRPGCAVRCDAAPWCSQIAADAAARRTHRGVSSGGCKTAGIRRRPGDRRGDRGEHRSARENGGTSVRTRQDRAPCRIRPAQALKRARSPPDARRDDGHVRRCHGDLHLGNICLFDGRPVPFDAIEFRRNSPRSMFCTILPFC